MKQKILSLAVKFETAYYITDNDERREQWKQCIIELYHFMHSFNDEQRPIYEALYCIWESAQCSNESLVINALKWYAETFRPTFKHDCERCTYYGTMTIDNEVYDFYICKTILDDVTVIGRYDDEPCKNLTWSLSDVDNHPILKHIKTFMN
jgi:hypothetical protein